MINYALFYCVFLILCSYGIKIKKSRKLTLDKEQTLEMRGLGMIIIVMSHVVSGTTGTFFFYISGALGVSLCFLASGYGLEKAYNLQENYLDSFLVNKIIRCIVPYLVIYCAWLTCYKINGNNITLYFILHNIFTLTMGDQLLWYLKIQLLLYLFFWINYRFFRDKKTKISAVVICVIVYCIVCIAVKAETFWYKSVLMFPAGLILAEYDTFFLKFVKRKIIICMSALIMLSMYLVIFVKGRMGIELVIDSVYMLSFVVLVLAIISSFIGFRLFKVCGKYSMELYLVHLMILYFYKQIITARLVPFAYTIFLAFSILLSIIFKKINDYLIDKFKQLKT